MTYRFAVVAWTGPKGVSATVGRYLLDMASMVVRAPLSLPNSRLRSSEGRPLHREVVTGGGANQENLP